MTTTTGLTLRFLRDDDGHPNVMYLLDRLGVCPVCGHEVIERVYAETSYHHLTVARLRQLASAGPEGFAQTCEQCGEALDAEDVARWTLTYGFPQEPGLLQAFGRKPTGGSAELVYAIAPHRDLDAQMLPEWEVPDDQSLAVFASLTEAEVQAVTGRYLNLKAAWRRLLRGWLARPADRPVVVELARGCSAIVGPSVESVEVAVAGLRDEAPGATVSAALLDPINVLVVDGPRDWLPDEWLEALARGRPWAVAIGHVGVAAELLRDALTRLPVTATCEIDDSGVAEVAFPVGRAEPVRRTVALAALLLEALVTGSAPADWIALWVDDCLVDVTGDELP